MSANLSHPADQGRYFALKKEIKEAFYKVSLALKEIIERRLYKVEYSSFDEFCEGELGMGRSQAYRIAAASGVIQNITESQSVANWRHFLPENEGQARELARLEPDQQIEVSKQLAQQYEPHEVTASVIRETADQFLSHPIDRPSEPLGDTHLTPEEILHVVFFTMKGIDLDPCADPDNTSGARTYFTKERNGLYQPWRGSVFVHPPASSVGQFVEKAVLEVQAETCKAAILYLPVEPWKNWYRHLIEFPHIFTPKDENYKAGRMLVLVSNNNEFLDEFCQYGAEAGSIYGYIGE